MRFAKSSAVNGRGLVVAGIASPFSTATPVCAYFCRKRASASAMCSISEGSTLSFGAWIRQLRLLDAEQHDLRVRVGLCQHVAERDRAALALGRHRPAERLLHRGLHRFERGAFERAHERDRRRRRARSRTACPTARATPGARRARPGPPCRSSPAVCADSRARRLTPARQRTSRSRAARRSRARSPTAAPRASPRRCPRPSASRRRARSRR